MTTKQAMSLTRKTNPIRFRFESLIPYIYPSTPQISIIPFFSTIFYFIFLVFILSTISNLNIGVSVGRPRPSPYCLLIAWSSTTQRFQIQLIKWRCLWETFESKSLFSTKAKDKTSNITSSPPTTYAQINPSGTSVSPINILIQITIILL